MINYNNIKPRVLKTDVCLWEVILSDKEFRYLVMDAPSPAIKQMQQIAGHVYRAVIMKVKENRPLRRSMLLNRKELESI